MQLLIDLADNKFGKNDCNKDKAKILSTFSAFNDPTKAGYLTSDPKKTFNLLWHAFIQGLIFYYFDPKQHILIKINVLDYAISRVLS